MVHDPDVRAVVLRDLAYDRYSNHQVAYDQMAEMLGLIDAAQWWAFNEQEEAWALDMFDYYPPGSVS